MDQQEKNNPSGGGCGWDSGFYETGSTRPPRNYGGLIAGALVVGILLFGMFNSTRNWDGTADPDKQTDSTAATDGSGPLLLREENQTPTDGAPTEPSAAGEQGELKLNSAPESVENVPQTGGLSLQEIYERNIASVASITCTLSGGTASGSGVVLSADGLIVTNAHVVKGATEISILLTDGRTLEAGLVGMDTLSDLAVLRVDAEDLTPAEFGDSSALRVGDAVVAIGDPLGIELRGTMTDGIVSAINRDVTTGGRTMTLIQTNAALNSGNSGGPLINCYGQVIGINTMKMGRYVSDTTVEGLGFAIPSTTVKEIVDQLIRQGYVSGRPGMGLTGETVSDFYQRFYHLPAGVYVSAVDAGGAAETAGIQAGDVILSVKDSRIESNDDLQTALYACQVGDQIAVSVYRGGYQITLELTLEEAT